MAKKKIRPPVKTHGGKHYLSQFIIEHFPKNYEEMTYCEPMCAGASVFLNKNPSENEVISDIDEGIVSLFKSLRDEPEEFIDRVKVIEYKEESFTEAIARSKEKFDDYLDRGVNEFILRRMSRGGMKKAFAWSDRQRGGKPGEVNSWETMIKELPRIADRVKNTTIVNKSVFEVIKAWDEEDTFFYLDPPYLHSTRTEGSTDIYEHEMTVDDHINLLNIIISMRGRVMISGYASPLYNRSLKDWFCKKKSISNHSSQAKTKQTRQEVIWTNYR